MSTPDSLQAKPCTMNRHDFPIFRHNPNLCYLDSAATSQKPDVVLRDMQVFAERYYANVRRGVHSLSDMADFHYNQVARQTVADFIGAKPHEIVFTQNATAGINLVARGFVAHRDYHRHPLVWHTKIDHNSNILPWRALPNHTAIAIDPSLDALQTAFKLEGHQTALLALPHVSNVLGYEMPIEEIITLSHQHNTPVLVDAAQSVGHTEINVTKLDADFLVFSAHKMLGPTGIGVLYINERWHDQIHPVFWGGGMVDGENPAKMPDRIEAGTPPIIESVGLAAAINYIKSVGEHTLASHCVDLANRCTERLQTLPGIRILGPSPKVNLVSFIVEELHPHDVAFELDRLGIAVRAGHHCAPALHKTLGISGSVRASFHIYNTLDDIDRLIDGLRHVQHTFTRVHQ